MIVPNPLGAKFIYFLGSILFGGVIATGVTGGAIMIPEFTSTGAPSTISKVAIIEPFNAFLTATGGNVKTTGPTGANGAKYAAFCIPNPLTKLTPSQGSGAPIIAWSFQMGNNPGSLSYDVDFVKSCTAGTGSSLMNNVQLATGAVLTLSGSRLPLTWNGADFIKGATLTTPNSATTGRFRGFVTDVFGE